VRFNGKVAIVTGGGRGIGCGICLRLATEGASVVVADLDLGEARKVVEEIESSGGQALAALADVTRAADIHHMVDETIKRFGTIDILVNNAGVAIFSPFLETSEEIWDRTINTNLKGTFLCTQAVARVMIERGRGGKIVNIASTASEVAVKGLAHYNASKGGVRLLTKAMALELAPYKINVNAVAPGTTETRLVIDWLADPAFKAEHLKQIPLGRIGQPKDIAAAVAFFASEEAGWITGQTLYVDGGYTIP